MEYVIGVDIGGTKSHLALFDIEGNYVDFGHWGPLNYERLEGLFDQFEEELWQFIKQVLDKNGITLKQIAYTAIGAAGVDTKFQHSTISEIIKRLGLEKFTLSNDAYLGIMAGSKTGTGICAINGTGCTIAGINKKGDMLQIGGLGFVTADMGGGRHICERMISKVYCELFRKGEPTIMTPILFEKLGITSKYDFAEKMQEKLYDGTFDTEKSNRLVFGAVSQNDSVAAGIMHEMAESYANGVSCMIEELKFPPDEELCIVPAGSIFVKGEHPLLVESLKQKISSSNPDYNITYNLLNVPNAAGAVIWAFNSLGSKGGFYDKVRAQFRNK
jgi:N-acetylglucosamine kinase-like BadF-type ATPase